MVETRGNRGSGLGRRCIMLGLFIRTNRNDIGQLLLELTDYFFPRTNNTGGFAPKCKRNLPWLFCRSFNVFDRFLIVFKTNNFYFLSCRLVSSSHALYSSKVIVPSLHCLRRRAASFAQALNSASSIYPNSFRLFSH